MANYDIKGSKTEANLLAAFSGEVHRVVCGVGLVLKGGRK